MSTATSVWHQARDYFDLTKPRITLLVLITEFTGMWFAAGGPPPLGLTVLTLLGTALAAGSSSVLNNYVDRHVDGIMARTRGRALPSGRLQARPALLFGFALGGASFLLLLLTVNALAASLAVATIAFYVVIYTIWLKRTSPLCTSIGGVAGAAPPLIGWAAVTGDLSLTPWVLFGIMFLWQPPHFWALALLRAEDYRQAGLPMLPVVRGERVTKRQMLLYTIALIPASLGLAATGTVGMAYVAIAAVLGAAYLALTIDFVRKPMTAGSARRLFFFSIFYLTVLFVAMFADFRAAM